MAKASFAWPSAVRKLTHCFSRQGWRPDPVHQLHRRMPLTVLLSRCSSPFLHTIPAPLVGLVTQSRCSWTSCASTAGTVQLHPSIRLAFLTLWCQQDTVGLFLSWSLVQLLSTQFAALVPSLGWLAPLLVHLMLLGLPLVSLLATSEHSPALAHPSLVHVSDFVLSALVQHSWVAISSSCPPEVNFLSGRSILSRMGPWPLSERLAQTKVLQLQPQVVAEVLQPPHTQPWVSWSGFATSTRLALLCSSDDSSNVDASTDALHRELRYHQRSFKQFKLSIHSFSPPGLCCHRLEPLAALEL